MCDKVVTVDWEAVLVDWVNCLKLYKHIQTIEELRDGVFLRCLRKIIKKSTDPIPDDDLTIIFQLLSNHYPKITFKEKDSIHISDLPRPDFVLLLSLLMHYTCIYDRRNVLTSPMCYNLSLLNQLYIKSFLESVNSDTSTDELTDIIKNIFDKKEGASCQQLMPTVISTTPVKKSPLQDFLKTPAWKYLRLQEKDKQIEQLKQELEAERDKKEGFEVELREQLEKTKKQLKQKCIEVKQLRAEMESSEMRTPPHFQDVHWRETERLLKTEIQSLEQYVQKCDREQEELRRERDLVKEKAKSLETESTMYQQKCFEIEDKYQNLLEISKQLETKNQDLQANFDEVQALLNDRKHETFEDYCDESMQFGPCPNRRSRSLEREDLAHSVVDVQLKEAQKLLQDTLEDLDALRNEKTQLEMVLEEGRCNLELARGDLKGALEEKELAKKNLADAFVLLTETQSELSEIKRALNNVACEKRDLEKTLNESISKLEEIGRELEEKNLEIIDLKLSQTLLEKSHQEENSRLIQNVQDCEAQREELSKELLVVDVQVKEAQKLLQNTLEDLDALKNEKTQLQVVLEEGRCNLEVAKEDLKRALEEKGRAENNLADTFVLLTETQSELSEIKGTLNNVACEKQDLEKTLSEAQRKLEETGKEMSEKNREIMDLKLYLEKSQEENSRLIKNVQDSEAQREELSKQLAERDLAHSVVDVQLKEAQKLLQNTLEDLDAVRNERKQLEVDFEEGRCNLEGELKSALEEKKRAKNTLADAFDLLTETQSELHEMNRTLTNVECEKQDLEKTLNEVRQLFDINQSKLEEIGRELNEKNREIMDSKLYQTLLEKSHEEENSRLTKNVQNAEAQREELSKQLLVADVQLKEAQKQLQNTLEDLNALRNEKTQLEIVLEEGRCNLEVARGDLKRALEEKEREENNLTEVFVLLTETRTELREIKTAFHNVVGEKQDLEKALSEALGNLNESRQLSESNQRKLEQAGRELNEKNREIMELRLYKTLLEESQKENSQLIHNIQDFEAKLIGLQTEKEDLSQQLAEFIEKDAQMLKELEIKSQAIEQLENMKEEYESSQLYYKKLEQAVEALQLKEEQLEALEITLSCKERSCANHLAEIHDLTLIASEYKELRNELAQKLLLSDIASFERDSLEGQKRRLLEQVQEKAIIVKTLDEALKKSEKTVEELENQLWDALRELQKTQEEKTLVSNFLELNNNELTKITLERDELLKALEMSNQDNLEWEQKYNELTNEQSKLFEDKENLQRASKEKERTLDNVSAQLGALQRDYEDLQNGHKDNESEIKKLLLSNRELLELLEASKRDCEDVYVNFEQVQKEQKDLENEYKKLLIENNDLAKEKNDIYDYLQKSVEEKEVITIERNRLQEDNVQLTQERNALYQKLQTALDEKHKLLLSLDLSQKETHKVKKERNEILQSQTEVMKETETNIQRAHEAAVDEKRKLLKRVESAEKDNVKLREAYTAVVAANSRYELEHVGLRNLIEDRNKQIQQFGQIKEAYEKLLESNDRYASEIETLKCKRAKDRDEFVRLLKKEREDGKAVETKRIKQIRAEYEEKLEKMKEKMVKLYREEVNKEMQKVKGEHADVTYLQNVIDGLEAELIDLKEKLHVSKDRYASQASLRPHTTERNCAVGISGLKGRGNKVADRDSVLGSTGSLAVTRESCAREQLQKVRSTSNLLGRESVTHHDNNKRMSTLPSRLRPGDFVEETITLSRRTSINSIGRNLEMEDEQDDMFNNDYLTDLKEGRCVAQAGRESNNTRISQLIWRNSMVSAHLKSSYPAEMQFVSPTRFREDDIKTGNLEIEDSMCRLLPAEKPRQKKDFGTTSYKKPGPPTPSKNGGRPSLQGNEVQPLREHNSAASTPNKKITPGRIKALFRGFKEGGTNTNRDNAENVTPRGGKRISFFKNRR